jgi:hypothetical protein
MDPIFIYLLKASGILGLFYIVYLAFLEKETLFRENRRFLLFGIFCALVGPIISIPVYIPVEPSQFSQVLPAAKDALPSDRISENPLDLWSFVEVLYYSGAILLLLRFALQLYSLRSIITTPAKFRKMPGVTFVETSRNIAPFSFFHYIVYNPSLYSATDLEAILAHEKAHCSQKHSFDILLSHLLTIVLWMNPISFLYRNTVRQNLEFLADSSATREVPSKKSYQYALLKVAGQQLPLPIINQFYNSLIKKRIVMLQKSKSRKANFLKSALVLPALALFLFSFNTREIYVPASETANLNWVAFDDEGKIEIKITKDTSDADLLKIKQDMAKEGVDFSYTVVRNSNKEIIDLTVDMNAKPEKGSQFKGSSSFENDGAPIDPVTLVFDEENHFLFMGGEDNRVMSGAGKQKKMTWTMDSESDMDEETRARLKEEGVEFITIVEEVQEMNDENGTTMKVIIEKEDTDKDSKHITVKRFGDKGAATDKSAKVITRKIYVDEKGNKTVTVEDGKGENEKIIIIESDEEGTGTKVLHEKHIIMENHMGGKDMNVMIFKDGEEDADIDILEKEGDGVFIMDSDSGKKPLFFIDGKEVKEKKVKALNPNEITSVNVYKGEKAIKKYGKKAKDGVVEITTKKNQK